MFKTQVVVFLLLCGAARSAEYINAFLGQRWRSFATQNYFDPRGVFISVLFSGPIILNVLVLVVRPCCCARSAWLTWRAQCTLSATQVLALNLAPSDIDDAVV